MFVTPIKYLLKKSLHIVYIFIFIVLSLLRPFLHIKFGILHAGRIGHLALNTDLFLRRLKLNIFNNNVRYFFFYSDNDIVSNSTLLNIYKLHLTIYKNNFMFYFINFILINYGEPFFLQKLEMNSNEYFEFNNCNAIISLSKDQINKGNIILSNMFIYNYYLDDV